jgi:hypothetical protein
LFVVVFALTEKDAAVGDMSSGLNAVVNMLNRIDQRGSEDRPETTSQDLGIGAIVVRTWYCTVLLIDTLTSITVKPLKAMILS